MMQRIVHIPFEGMYLEKVKKHIDVPVRVPTFKPVFRIRIDFIRIGIQL
jgi:hypothetical protein